jgi:hypothetical protein
MSDAALDFGRRFPRIARLSSVAVSPSLIRWTLRLVTLLLFGAATAVGVNVGMNAPEIAPTSVVHDDRVASPNP